jgi:DNA-binding MarR family transcriptional regulator
VATKRAAADSRGTPVLLRYALGAYANTVAARLAAAGFGDLPRNGPFVLGGMANHGESAVDLIQGLGVSRQAVSQLIDTLVLRGYLSRQVNSDDRRRLDIELTERGRAAAAVVQTAIKGVDRQLTAMVSPGELAGLRAGLVALATIKEGAQSGRDAEEL